MPLTDLELRKLKPTGRRRRFFDAGGLYLELSPTGGCWWRLKYRYLGKEKRLSLGTYPEVSLKDARFKRDDARKLLRQGIDPSAVRRAERAAGVERAANSFEIVAREWLDKQSAVFVPDHAKRVKSLFETDLFPWLGKRPVAEITAPELLGVLRRIEGREALDTAHRARAHCGQVFRYAIATGRAERDPSADLRGALPPATGGHFAAITEPTRAGELLRMLWGHEGTPVVNAAVKLAPLLFVRPGELRTARWADIDMVNGEWRFIASKTETHHIVPLATQAVAILRELHRTTGAGQYVFPSERGPSRPMSSAAVLAAMRSMGIPSEEMSGHGFRAMARTMLDEQLHFPVDIIEHQLAHNVRDPLGRAYNRTAHLPERRRMMQEWADYLDKLRADVKVLPLKREAAA